MRKVIWSLVILIALVLGALAAFPASVIDDPEPVDTAALRIDLMETFGANHGVFLHDADKLKGVFYRLPLSPLKLFDLSRDMHVDVVWYDPILPGCWAELSECESDASEICQDAGHGACGADTATITPHDDDDQVTCSCECEFDAAVPFIIGEACPPEETIIDECDPTGWFGSPCFVPATER